MNKVGRPTKYNEETLVIAKEYLEGGYRGNEGDHDDDREVIPSICGLALKLDITRETVHQWGKDEEKPLFSYILGQILAKQERVLVSRGLSGDFNAPMAKLMLTKHGYADAAKSEVTGNISGVLGLPASPEDWAATAKAQQADAKQGGA